MAKNNIFDKLSGLWIPSEIMKIKDITATQKMILALANFKNGLKLSNANLSHLLGIDRRNVIYNIQKLRKKEYLIDKGPDRQRRILRVNSDKLPPLEGMTGDKTPLPKGSSSDKTPLPKGSSSDKTPPVKPQSSDASITHKYNTSNNTTTTFSFHLRGNEDFWNLPEEKFNSYLETYTTLDVESELRKAAQWLIDNPTRRKTARGMPRFLNGWLSRAKPTPPQEYATRDLTEQEAEELMKEVTA